MKPKDIDVILILKKDDVDRAGTPDYIKEAYRVNKNLGEKNHYIKSWIDFISEIPKKLDWPLFCNYIYFGKTANLFNTQYYKKLAEFLRTEWKEYDYPEKVWLRGAVIREFGKKLLPYITYEWIKENSTILYEKEPWIAFDLEREFNKDKALLFVEIILKSKIVSEEKSASVLINKSMSLFIEYSVAEIEPFISIWLSYFSIENQEILKVFYLDKKQEDVNKIASRLT